MADREHTDRTRTLDEILDDARREPPVLSREETLQLLTQERTAATGTSIAHLNWQGYLMAGLIFIAATTVAILSLAPGSNENVVTESRRDYAPRVTQNVPPQVAAFPDSPTASAPSTTTALPRATKASEPAKRKDASASQPTTGNARQWGYDFVAGQTLRYRYVSEYSHPAINDAFSTTTVVDLFVEAVDADGSATLVITLVTENFEQDAKPTLPDGLVFERGRHPDRMRVTVTRAGRIVAGEIISDDKKKKADHGANVVLADGSELQETPKLRIVSGYFERLVPQLPENLDALPNRTLRDSNVRSYQVPQYRDGDWTVFMHHDTITSTTSIVGKREIAGHASTVVVVNTNTTSHDPGDQPARTATVQELYLRASDGIPVRIQETHTSHHGTDGSTSHTTLELIGETYPATSTGQPDTLE